MKINSNYNTEKKYSVLSQCCVRGGEVVADASGDTWEQSVEGAILSLKALKGKVRNSNELYAWKAGINVLKAAHFDF